jgi:Fe-S-cluster-containing dehydrogenase component
MVINPDVTVRSRGVMEKCSFCVQNIQSAKLTAKRENRTLKDGEVTVACARACPSNAIVFGDMNDKDSELSKLHRNERSYAMLEELNTVPSVKYMTKIRNRKEKAAPKAH